MAGVADIDRAQAALQFAKKYELLDSESLRNIKLIELDYSDVESLSSTIPRRGKLVIVDGDVIAGGSQTDVSQTPVQLCFPSMSELMCNQV